MDLIIRKRNSLTVNGIRNIIRAIVTNSTDFGSTDNLNDVTYSYLKTLFKLRYVQQIKIES